MRIYDKALDLRLDMFISMLNQKSTPKTKHYHFHPVMIPIRSDVSHFFPTLIAEGTRKLAGLGFEGVATSGAGVASVEALESWAVPFFDGAGAPRGGNSSSEITAAAGAAVVRG